MRKRNGFWHLLKAHKRKERIGDFGICNIPRGSSLSQIKSPLFSIYINVGRSCAPMTSFKHFEHISSHVAHFID